MISSSPISLPRQTEFGDNISTSEVPFTAVYVVKLSITPYAAPTVFNITTYTYETICL